MHVSACLEGDLQPMMVWPKRVGTAVLAGFLTFSLAACGEPSKAKIVEDARGVETRTALLDALGEPDGISKLGPVEKWTYKASDGRVVFMITGDKVIVEAAN